jgi:hypothetical protein
MSPAAPEEQRTSVKETADRKMPARAAAPGPAEDESSPGPDIGADLDKDPGYDERLEWMKARMSSALVSSGDKTKFNFFKDTDAMFPCWEFLDYEATRIVFVYAGADGRYVAASVAPIAAASFMCEGTNSNSMSEGAVERSFDMGLKNARIDRLVRLQPP